MAPILPLDEALRQHASRPERRGMGALGGGWLQQRRALVRPGRRRDHQARGVRRSCTSRMVVRAEPGPSGKADLALASSAAAAIGQQSRGRRWMTLAITDPGALGDLLVRSKISQTDARRPRCGWGPMRTCIVGDPMERRSEIIPIRMVAPWTHHRAASARRPCEGWVLPMSLRASVEQCQQQLAGEAPKEERQSAGG
jgi:hypothetical protein